MKKYEYVSLNYKTKDVVKGILQEHRQVISDYAAKGYRYAGLIPTEIGANGYTRKVDLIFEIDA